ncbi:hypothetical protein [Sinorhizobium sp. CCBAU 05631]|uniref:hypothetical protein n=1 Tax=Sinorhizobium sp. CCBAU 05631 TaxID=794846 RepID=UPI0004B44471|nr:hypothetical protein [Sinorhizobium sp. CCBAU 05631]ASY61394.1 hypothetical protein SS05631_d64930 [Sinorhizobium sp. CCBAU 05631]
MKPYGILDGLAVGFAAALLIIVGVVATHAYDWLAWAALPAALLVVVAIVLAAWRGHGMVDGVMLRPWQRQLLLAVVTVELVGISVTPLLKSKVDNGTPPPVEPSTLVTDGCGRLVNDMAALEQVVESREGTARDALRQYAKLRVEAKACDSLSGRLAAVQVKLASWNSENNELRIDVEKLEAELNALPAPMIEPPPAPADAPTDSTPFVPDFAYIPPALIPPPPPPSSDESTTVTIEEKRRSFLDAILRLFSGGFNFGSTKITTTEILGETMQSADDHGKALLQAMADSIPKDRPDRLAEFWLQLRMLANEPETPEDQRQAINGFLYDQGPVPFLCDWVLLSLKERIGEEVAARIRVDESSVNDVVKSANSDEWPKVYAEVHACVFNRDRNHFGAYQPALGRLQSTRIEVSE